MEQKEQYVCPMHPEVVSDTPGRCSTCGMKLVKKEKMKNTKPVMDDKGLGDITWRSYIPLGVILALISVAALIPTLTIQGESGFWYPFLINFMTGFFLVFGGFKLLDLKGFAEGYSTYDLIAQKWFGYGYFYPFIELGFGFVMLAGFHPEWLLWSEFILMSVSGLGVVLKLAKREQIQCVCLGTTLKVPLTYVTLIEDFGMATLALLLVLLF